MADLAMMAFGQAIGSLDRLLESGQPSWRFEHRCRWLQGLAFNRGGHSVVRVLGWALLPRTWDRHEPDAILARLHRVGWAWAERVAR